MIRSAIASIAAVWCSSAGAEVLASCGASAGMAFYPEGPIVSAADAGWREDGLSGGRIILAREGDEFEIVFRDPSGTRSTADEGAVTILVHEDEDTRLLVVVFPSGAAETYQFRGGAQPEVLWTQNKAGGFIDKIAGYRAACD